MEIHSCRERSTVSYAVRLRPHPRPTKIDMECMLFYSIRHACNLRRLYLEIALPLQTHAARTDREPNPPLFRRRQAQIYTYLRLKSALKGLAVQELSKFPRFR